MIVDETESILIFREVTAEALQYFKDFELELWFLEGKVKDGLFEQSFVGSGLDLSEYKVDSDEDDDVTIELTLYFKKEVLKEDILKNVEEQFTEEELETLCDN